MGLIVFSLAWMLTTLLLPWPRPFKGPQIVPQISWSKQDAPPQEVVGLRIVITLEGHYPRRTFVSRIEGCRPILMELERNETGETDRVYVLRTEENAKEAGQFLFIPIGYNSREVP